MNVVCAALALSVLIGPGVALAGESVTQRGPVSATVRVTTETIRIGDALDVELEVVAEPGVELLMPVFGESLERFRIVDFVPRERVDEQARTVSTQRYRLQAMTSGEHTIPSIIVEFVDRRPGEREAPEGEDAYELLTEPVEFIVDSVVPTGSGKSLRAPLGRLEPVKPEASSDSAWVLGIVALVLSAILTWRWLVAWRKRARRRDAFEAAFSRLAALRAGPRPSAETMDDFFVELSDIVRRYLEDRFALHAPELTTEEFLDVAAASPDLDADRQRFLQGFLKSADRVKFARYVPSADYVETVLDAVADFLERTRAVAAPGTESEPALA